MSFAMQRADGPWVGVLTGVELNTFDRNLSRALDGFAGGAYAPSAFLEIGGSGLRLAGLNHEIPSGGKLTVKSGGTLTLDPGSSIVMGGALAVSNVLTITGTGALLVDAGASITFNANATFNANTTLGNADTDVLTVNASAQFNALALFTAAMTVNGAATFSGSLTANGAAFLNGNVGIGNAAGDTHTVFGTTTFNDPIVLAGDARVRWRIVDAPDADTTFSIADADLIYINGGSITAARVYQLSTTGAATGDMIAFVTRHVPDQITAGGHTMKHASGFRNRIAFVFRAGGWNVCEEEWKP